MKTVVSMNTSGQIFLKIEIAISFLGKKNLKLMLPSPSTSLCPIKTLDVFYKLLHVGKIIRFCTEKI